MFRVAILVLPVLVLTATCKTTAKLRSGASFEGVLVYSVKTYGDLPTLKSGLNGQNLDLPDSVHITYRNDCYKISDRNMRFSIYKGGEDNRIYQFTPADSLLLCSIQDAAIDPEFKILGRLPKVLRSDSIFEIKGLKCLKVSIVWTSGTFSYYFEPNMLRMNPDFYANHHYDGWAAYLKISEALPVRIEKVIGGSFKVVYDLERMQQTEVSIHTFDIPELEPLDGLKPNPVGNRMIYKVKN